MLKDGPDILLLAILDVFNDVLALREEPPRIWKQTRLTVIFKKGDPQMPGNYRPIAVIPILYKLFSRMLCNRLTKYIMEHQSVDQAAYRKGFSTADHLLTVSLLIEKSGEFNYPLWLALVDFEKAFDTVEHSPLWKVLEQQGVPSHYIKLLELLYTDQQAYVQAGVKSRMFSIERGVKQGDPISALLFIAVMQACFAQLQLKWGRLNLRRTGIKFGLQLSSEGGDLTNLRFADDVILVARQKSDIRKMLQDLSEISAKHGLKIHFGKTKIMTWNCLSASCASIKVDEHDVKIMDEAEAERYLGRKLCFADSQLKELNNRIAAGWAAFHKHKGELCSKFYRLCDRARLFDAVVMPAVLYGASTWALTQKMERKLKTVRRRMLRYVFRIHRRRGPGPDFELEDWVTFVKNTAAKVDAISDSMGMTSWVVLHRRHKWQFAGKLARKCDNRWSQQVVNWQPNFGMGRSAGAPKTRWADQLEKFAGGEWMTLAQHTEEWDTAEDVFANWDFQ
jgi:hypothetical protein